MSAVDTTVQASGSGPTDGPVIEAIDVTRRFGDKVALDRVSVAVAPGEIHALLGPNGAGKTTLVRVLTGLAQPDAGTVRLLGHADITDRAAKGLVGLVPSGDRTFYLRISGFENLLFFARLHGLGKAEAAERVTAGLEAVGLADTGRKPVGQYSHGMQKRLGIARALLTVPPVLFVDEATHDLDPAGSRHVQELVRQAAAGGTAVIWTTQRVDEIRGFADRVSVLREGRVRFEGSVPQLMSVTVASRFVMHLHADGFRDEELIDHADDALGGLGIVSAGGDGDGEHFLVSLREGTVLGTAVAALTARDIEVLSCREERSEIEAAFLFLTEGST